MRTIVALLFLFLPLTLNAQYSTAYVWGVSDLSAKASSTNLWYELPGGGVCNIPSLGNDMYLACAANGTTTPGSNNVIYYYNTSTHGWGQIAALGSGWVGLAVVTQNNMYLLKASTFCTQYNGYAPFHWDGTTLTALSGCGTKIQAGDDGTIVLVNSLNNMYYLPPGGNTWLQIDTSAGWVSASAADVNNMCGVKNGQVYQYSSYTSGTFTVLPAQPFGTAVSCYIGNDPNLGATMYALSTYQSGRPVQTYDAISYYDFTTNTWVSSVLPDAKSFAMSSVSRWGTVLLDSAGHPWHFNVYGTYLQGTTTGSVNGCPPPNPCTGTVVHTGTIQVKLPGGLYGAQSQQAVCPTCAMNVSSFDVSASACDFLFGDPNQCTPTATGTVICSESLANLGGGASSSPPSPPMYVYSENYTTFSGTPNITASYAYEPGGWLATAECTPLKSACKENTVPYCFSNFEKFTHWQNPATQAQMEKEAKDDCGKGPFTNVFVYVPGHPDSCTNIKVDKYAKIPGNCF